MKKTIKQLEEELSREREENMKYRGRNRELENRLGEIDREERMKINASLSESVETNGKLLEIIRWMVNPETTKSPFMPTKDQREDRDKYGYRL